MEREKEIDALFARLKNDCPKELGAFASFSSSIKSEGTLSKKQKDLTLISLAVYSQCEWCISIHIKNALQEGATKEEILEASMLAVLMGGGPKLMYINIVYDELDRHGK